MDHPHRKAQPAIPWVPMASSFIEFAAPDPCSSTACSAPWVFLPGRPTSFQGRHPVSPGEINFILNAEQRALPSPSPGHGPSIFAIALRVKDGPCRRPLRQILGAEVLPGGARPMELNIPAMRGVGGSLNLPGDRYEDRTAGQHLRHRLPADRRAPKPSAGLGLKRIDHLSCCAYRGRMQVWAEFLERNLQFRETPSATDSRLMTSPCGPNPFPVREPSSDEPNDPVATFHRCLSWRRHRPHGAFLRRH